MAIMPKTTWSDVAKKLEACLADISIWMSASMLKLNEEKTELIIFNPNHQVRMNEELRLQVGNNTVSVASSVNNLGVYFDTSLAMERQVNAISKADMGSILFGQFQFHLKFINSKISIPIPFFSDSFCFIFFTMSRYSEYLLGIHTPSSLYSK